LRMTWNRGCGEFPSTAKANDVGSAK